MNDSSNDTPPPAAAYRYGYRHGMTQTGTHMTFSLPLPDNPDMERLDRDLGRLFQLEIAPARLAGDWQPDPTGGVVAQLAWRILSLAAYLQQAARIPALDPGAVVDVTPGETAYAVKVALPLVDLTPAQIVRQAYESATRCVLQLAQDPSAARDPQAIWQALHKDFIDPVSHRVPGGDAAIPLLKAAHAANIPFRHLGDGIYQLGWGCNAVLLDRSGLGYSSAMGARASANKHLSACILRAAGLPAPTHHLVWNREQALAAARQLGMPVVVKPADRNRGEGVSIDINDEPALARAWDKAARESRLILVEKQVTGSCLRVYVFRGEVLYAVKRLPKSVRGDGHRTVSELVTAANRQEQDKPPWNRHKAFPLDELARQSLAESGLSPEAVPAEGQFAPLRPFSTVEWGGALEDLTATLHPDNRELAVRIARLFELETAGVDLITPDAAQPWHSNGAIINEVDFSPMLTNEPTLRATWPPRMIERAVSNGGRIPVEIFPGGQDAMERGTTRQRQCASAGEACYLTSSRETRSPSGEPCHLAAEGLFDRCRALLVNDAVERLVVVMDSDEWQHTGLPVDAIHHLDPGGDVPGGTLLHHWLDCYSL